jgi:hypothetical protein
LITSKEYLWLRIPGRNTIMTTEKHLIAEVIEARPT